MIVIRQDNTSKKVNIIGKNSLNVFYVLKGNKEITIIPIEGNIKSYQDKMSEKWSFLPQHFLTSSEKKIGNEEILDFIETTSKSFTPVKE